MLTAEALLAGPRGRRLCWTLLGIGGDDAGRTDAWGQVWRADTVRREDSLRDGPEEPLGAWSGNWWSDPALPGLPVTTRARPGLGALRLALVEDRHGWTSARCWPLAARA
ncbi:MAG TPA: hypothetical protein VGD91_24190, partial [Trebonia sp.]